MGAIIEFMIFVIVALPKLTLLGFSDKHGSSPRECTRGPLVHRLFQPTSGCNSPHIPGHRWPTNSPQLFADDGTLIALSKATRERMTEMGRQMEHNPQPIQIREPHGPNGPTKPSH